MSGKYAKAAFQKINSSLSENDIETLSAPISCSALLAEKMGASEIQKLMASDTSSRILPK